MYNLSNEKYYEKTQTQIFISHFAYEANWYTFFQKQLTRISASEKYRDLISQDFELKA